MFNFINLALRGGTTLYYFANYVNGRQFVDWFNNAQSHALGRNLFTLQTSHLISWFNGLGIATTLIGVVMSKSLATRFGKRNVFLVGLFLSACFILAFAFIRPEAILWMMVCHVLYNLSYGPTIPLLWAMMADVADYTDWRTGRRATGMAFASIMFSLNSGLAIGGWLNGVLLRWYDFDERQSQQSARAVQGILWMFSVYPAIAFFIGCGALLCYTIDRPMEVKLERELTFRRSHLEAS
jgi:Na+/melibiose symporter-like transporter